MCIVYTNKNKRLLGLKQQKLTFASMHIFCSHYAVITVAIFFTNIIFSIQLKYVWEWLEARKWKSKLSQLLTHSLNKGWKTVVIHVFVVFFISFFKRYNKASGQNQTTSFWEKRNLGFIVENWNNTSWFTC